MELRPYCAADASAIVSWVSSERELRQWSSICFAEDPFPLTAERFDRYYREAGAAYMPCCAVENGELVGHVLLRWTEPGKTIRLGFVIVDSARRGHGLGRLLIEAACRRAFEELGAENITLGVFENNPAAKNCYAAAGFCPCGGQQRLIGGENWHSLEMYLTREQFSMRPDK